MAKKKAMPFDVADYLDSPEMIAAYLSEALASGDIALIMAAIGDVARAKGMAAVARDTGLAREHLYKALSSEGRPEFATVVKSLDALGIQLRATPKAA
jgi:probable addiction module antidote protein